MANWSKPALPDAYPDFLDSLDARDVDSGTMFLVDPTNPPTGIIRYNRSLNLFQEWSGTAWVNKVLAQAGGGTGAGSLPALGTMASQNANNVAITGGNMQGMTTVYANGELRSATHLRISGQLINGSSQIVLTDAVGKIPNFSSSYFSNTNIDGSFIGSGTINVNRLGSGAVGDGQRTLLDNGTWGFGGGGVRDLVHNDVAFGTNENDRTFVIPWAVMPTNINQVEFRLNGSYRTMDGVSGVNEYECLLEHQVVAVNQVRVTRKFPSGIINSRATAYKYTAIHYRITG